MAKNWNPKIDSPNTKYLIAVVGSTAIGKTALSVQLARHFRTEILSADARQFFREMSIGTAVPSSEELQAAPHHFVHHKSVAEPYSVGDFEVEAMTLLEALFDKHNVLILCGGSGLYVDAVTKGLDDFPKIDKDIRQRLNERLQTEGLEVLQRELKAYDPVHFGQIDTHNPHRLIRALEVCLQTGKPYSSFLGQKQKQRPFKTLKIGLTADRTLIYDRINRRVDVMMEQGLLQEAEKLYPQRHLNALQTVGYKELFVYMEGRCTLSEAVEEIKKNTRRFAKRQSTWFRKDPGIRWFDHDVAIGEVVRYVEGLVKR